MCCMLIAKVICTPSICLLVLSLTLLMRMNLSAVIAISSNAVFALLPH